MDDCVFCAIAAHRAPASLIYEDESSLAFLDIHPITRGHTLVIPREHCENIYELSETAGAAVIRAASRIARTLRQELQPDGLNLIQSNGRAAGQTVFHFHLHLVPRWNKDGLFLPPHSPVLAERTNLEALAEALRARL